MTNVLDSTKETFYKSELFFVETARFLLINGFDPELDDKKRERWRFHSKRN